MNMAGDIPILHSLSLINCRRETGCWPSGLPQSSDDTIFHIPLAPTVVGMGTGLLEAPEDSFGKTSDAKPVSDSAPWLSKTRIPTEDKARKRLQLWTYLTQYFPDAFIAQAEVAIAGNEQHNPGQPLHWAREKSTDQLNTAFRHMLDYGSGNKKDTDGQWHLAKAIWRLSAQLQLDIEAERRAANQ